MPVPRSFNDRIDRQRPYLKFYNAQSYNRPRDQRLSENWWLIKGPDETFEHHGNITPRGLRGQPSIWAPFQPYSDDEKIPSWAVKAAGYFSSFIQTMLANVSNCKCSTCKLYNSYEFNYVQYNFWSLKIVFEDTSTLARLAIVNECSINAEKEGRIWVRVSLGLI